MAHGWRTVAPERICTRHAGTPGPGPVVYWMSRDQRVADNWALLAAAELAREQRVELEVVFCLAPAFLGATRRQYGFMLRGLAETEATLRARGIPLRLLTGEPGTVVPGLLTRLAAAALVLDFDPLRLKQAWQAAVCATVSVPVYEVDAHNIVPARVASPKLEYAARTLRPKLGRLLPSYLVPFPALRPPPRITPLPPPVDWARIQTELRVDEQVPEVADLVPGSAAAARQLRAFLAHRLSGYAAQGNDPNAPVRSELSPYLHFGQIAAQRVALEARDAAAPPEARAAFLEELIVRRELADNFCLYNPAYDRFEGFPRWARATLDGHRADPRAYAYERDAWERGETHDALWNAAQLQMVRSGRMHSYLRMYWAKKILEWSPSPEEALELAIALNDRYELDGRDPNGYAGSAWSIGGVHDRAWGTRPIFGMIRYMSAAGCRGKFDVPAYVRRWTA